MQFLVGIIKRALLVVTALGLLTFLLVSLIVMGIVSLITGRPRVRVFTGSQDLGDFFRHPPPRDVTPIEPLKLE